VSKGIDLVDYYLGKYMAEVFQYCADMINIYIKTLNGLDSTQLDMKVAKLYEMLIRIHDLDSKHTDVAKVFFMIYEKYVVLDLVAKESKCLNNIYVLFQLISRDYPSFR
jgi:hypothetical protein